MNEDVSSLGFFQRPPPPPPLRPNEDIQKNCVVFEMKGFRLCSLHAQRASTESQRMFVKFAEKSHDSSGKNIKNICHLCFIGCNFSVPNEDR